MLDLTKEGIGRLLINNKIITSTTKTKAAVPIAIGNFFEVRKKMYRSPDIKTTNQEPRTKNQEPKTKNQKPRTKNYKSKEVKSLEE